MAAYIIYYAVVFNGSAGITADLDTAAHLAVTGRIVCISIAIGDGEPAYSGHCARAGNGHDRPLVISVNNGAVCSFNTDEVDRLVGQVNELLVRPFLHIDVVAITGLIQAMLNGGKGAALAAGIRVRTVGGYIKCCGNSNGYFCGIFTFASSVIDSSDTVVVGSAGCQTGNSKTGGINITHGIHCGGRCCRCTTINAVSGKV